MALTAAAPIFRGFLSNIDARWDVIAASVDDRTKQETGIRPLTTDKFRIHKSRYDSISHYLSSGPSYSGGCSGPRVGRRGENDGYADFYRSVYDDLDAGYDEQIYRKLLEEGNYDEISRLSDYLSKVWTRRWLNIMLICLFVTHWLFLKSCWIKMIRLALIILKYL